MKRILPTLLSAVLVITLLVFGGLSIESGSQTESVRLAEEAIHRAAVQCYALEGFYPTNVDYLIERYGIEINQKQFFVHYQYTADNLAPSITVIQRKADAS